MHAAAWLFAGVIRSRGPWNSVEGDFLAVMGSIAVRLETARLLTT